MTILVWLISFLLSFGLPALVLISLRRASSRPWKIKIDEEYRPRVSIIVPTYNESDIILFKLENLRKLEYPGELTETIIVDSNSDDGTREIVHDFVETNPNLNIRVLEEKERSGKSNALNNALRTSTGEVVIVSDADCFWPSDILQRALPLLADPSVGAISGPKVLLNPNQSWVTKAEAAYLKSMNVTKLGESKLSSTLFFEGGFSAYKRTALDAFDPYNTGSDDCGTVISLTERGARAIVIQEAEFFTAFPTTWKGKMGIKARRAGQLVRVFTVYASLILRQRVTTAKRIVVQCIFMYLVGPIFFIPFLAATFFLVLSFPYLLVFSLALLIPNVRMSLLEAIQSYLLILLGICFLVSRKEFILWAKPEDRSPLTINALQQHSLI